MNLKLMHVQPTNKISYYVLLSQRVYTKLLLKELLRDYKSNTWDIMYTCQARAIWFPLLYGTLKSDKVAMLFISQEESSRWLDVSILLTFFQNIQYWFLVHRNYILTAIVYNKHAFKNFRRETIFNFKYFYR